MATRIVPVANGYNYGVPSLGVKARSSATPKGRKGMSEVDRIRVCVRKRPISRQVDKGDRDVVCVDPARRQALVKEEKLALDLSHVTVVHKFHFDEVFNEDITNKGVYERTIQPFVPSVVQGGQATCFAFGQTGSGKTHTLLGDSGDRGLFQYATEDLFDLLKNNLDGLYVWISYFEIYCGQIYDLLNKREKIQALENDKHEVCIAGVNEVPVSSPYILSKFIQQGNNVRSQGTSGVNALSSRSHAVVQIQLKDVTGNKLGRLSIIDLAGSERACDRGDPDRAARLEGAEINTSLLSLKECIRAMDQEQSHTPFRQSKLTQILRDSLTGGAKTCMIATISPGRSAIEDTLNTLKYADRVKEIKQVISNPRTSSSYTPKGFSPHNTSTPMKGRTPSSTPVRKHASSLDRSRQNRGRSRIQMGSLDARREDVSRSHVPNGERVESRGILKKKKEDTSDDPETKGNQSKTSRNSSRHSVNEVSSPIRHEILSMNRSGDARESRKENANNDGKKGIVSFKGEGMDNIRKSEAVKKFLSNSLPIWEDESVEDDRIFAPSLSFAWEVGNPDYVMSDKAVDLEDSQRREVERKMQHSGRAWSRQVQENGATRLGNNPNLDEPGERISLPNGTKKTEFNRSWNRLEGKDPGLMSFENPRYLQKGGRINGELARFVDGNDSGVSGRVETAKQLDFTEGSSNVLMGNGYKVRDMPSMAEGTSVSTGIDTGYGNRSPSSILTENTLELMAEVDRCMSMMSIGGHPENGGYREGETEQSLIDDGDEYQLPPDEGRDMEMEGYESKLIGSSMSNPSAGSHKRNSLDGNFDVKGMRGDSNQNRNIPCRDSNVFQNNRNENNATLVTSDEYLGEHTPRRVAFFRETLQSSTRQWQLVTDEGHSPFSSPRGAGVINNFSESQAGQIKVDSRPTAGSNKEGTGIEKYSQEAFKGKKSGLVQSEKSKSLKAEDNSPLDLRINGKSKEDGAREDTMGRSDASLSLSVDNREQMDSLKTDQHKCIPDHNSRRLSVEDTEAEHLGNRLGNDSRGASFMESRGSRGTRKNSEGSYVHRKAESDTGMTLSRKAGHLMPLTNVWNEQGNAEGRAIDKASRLSREIEHSNHVVTVRTMSQRNDAKSDGIIQNSGSMPSKLVTPDDFLKESSVPLGKSPQRPRPILHEGGSKSGLDMGMLSPILEDGLGRRLTDVEDGLDNDGGGIPVESPTGRPGSALERSTVCNKLTTALSGDQVNSRELIVTTHQEYLEHLQQLSEASWETINRLNQGHMDIPDYVCEVSSLLESQQRCINTFQEQLGLYSIYTEHDERTNHIPVLDKPKES